MKSKLLLAIAFFAIISTIGFSREEMTTIGDVFDTVGKELNLKDFIDLSDSEKELLAEATRVINLPEAVRSIYGAKWVIVVVDLHGDAEEAGLTKKKLQVDVELKLRLAGINVKPFEGGQYSKENTFLKVNVGTVKDDSLFIYCIALGFRQPVEIVRMPELYTFSGTTWENTMFASSDKSRFKESVRDTLKDLTDLFINDYLTANPKK